MQIDKAEVKAPADGLILARNAQLGAVVSGAAGPLFRIAKDGAYEVVANVSETALLKLAPDMKAVLKLSGVTDDDQRQGPPGRSGNQRGLAARQGAGLDRSRSACAPGRICRS